MYKIFFFSLGKSIAAYAKAPESQGITGMTADEFYSDDEAAYYVA